MREALEAVKREVGPDAVILGTRSLPAGGMGALARRQRVEITVALSASTAPPPRPTPTTKPPHCPTPPSAAAPAANTPQPSVPEHLYPYYVKLVRSEVAEELAAQLVLRAAQRLSSAGDDADGVLRDTVRMFIKDNAPSGGGLTLTPGQTRRVALVGPSGSGKTTTLAKLSAEFKLRQKKNVVLLSLDMQRLGAHDSLRRYGDLIGVPVYSAQTITEVKNCLRNLSSVDLLLIDTPGIGLREQARFARLATLLRAARPDETHLVLPASLTPNVQKRVADSFKSLAISNAILTRLDDAVGFGVILNVIHRLNLGVSYVTCGQNIPNDIEEACGQRVAELLLTTIT